MKNKLLIIIAFLIGLCFKPSFSQEQNQASTDSTLLGLPGDNLNLYAVLDLFQNSKTIEEFEKSLNLEKTGINNLDLDLNNEVDFIKVNTEQNDDDFIFVLQVAVNEKENQDVAAIFVSKDKEKNITMQIVGDKELYGENFIVEPKAETTPTVTANPGYTGNEPVVVSAPATTTTVIIESAPIVRYVYSPVYVPYYPPYYYGYYPSYFFPFRVMAIGMYWGTFPYYHHHGYRYHGNTTIIHNTYTYNNYGNRRNTSITVNNNRVNGNYNNNRPSSTTRPSSGASPGTRPSVGNSSNKRPSKGNSTSTTRPSRESSVKTRPSRESSTKQPSVGTATTRPSSRENSSTTRQSTKQSTPKATTRPSSSNKISTPVVTPSSTKSNKRSNESSGGSERRR
jgi:hypothetical protein